MRVHEEACKVQCPAFQDLNVVRRFPFMSVDNVNPLIGLQFREESKKGR